MTIVKYSFWICIDIYLHRCAYTKYDGCSLLSSLSSCFNIPLATFCGCKQASETATRTYTYFLRQSKQCMFSYASLLFSLPRSFLLCLSSADSQCNKMQILSLSLSLIHTYNSFICTVSRIETDVHLKLVDKKKSIITMSSPSFHTSFRLRCFYFLSIILFSNREWITEAFNTSLLM